MCIHRDNFKSCISKTKQTKIQVRLHYRDITHSPHDMPVHMARPWHRHVMWAVCDVSVVQSHLYFGLFGWGYKIVPMYAHLNLSCSKRGGAKGVPLA